MYQKINFFLIFLLCGCANLGTISRVTKLSEQTTAVHLDSAQRLVYQGQEQKSEQNYMLCAEPTPDALQSYANAFGGSLTTAGKESTSLSNAFAVNSLGVGLHTQSITLMRDILYRICEASYNKRLSDVSVQQLLQRAQDLTLGVLAIEQLTGVVAARQPVIVNTTSSSAAGAINDYQAQLELAKGSESLKKSLLESAVKEEEKAKQDLVAKKLLYEEASKKTATDETEKNLAQLNSQISSLDATLSARTAARQAANVDYQRAVAATKAIESMEAAALNSSSGTTDGTQITAELAPRAKSDAESAANIATATVQIVKAIVGKVYLPDACLAIFSESATGNKKRFNDNQLKEISQLCITVIQSGFLKTEAISDSNTSALPENVLQDRQIKQKLRK